MRLPSIRRRMALLTLTGVLLWGIVTAAVVSIAIHREVEDVMDDALRESAELLYGVMVTQEAPLLGAGSPVLAAPRHQEKVLWQLVDAQGQVVVRSHEAPEAAFTPGRVGEVRFLQHADGYRVLLMPFRSDGWSLQVGERMDHRRIAGRDVVQAGMLATAAAAALLSLGLMWLVRHELQPLLRFSRSVQSVDVQQPGWVLPSVDRHELLPLRQAIDTLGQRLQQRVETERMITAQAAHALRTPLAGIMAQLDLAKRVPESQVLGFIDQARMATESLRRVVIALLSLFRSSGGAQTQPTSVQALLAALPEHRLKVMTRGDDALELDPDQFSALLINLMDNSRKAGAQHFDVHTHQSGRHVCVDFIDDGRGVDPALALCIDEALATHRFEKPLGLGLMLADRVALTHRGTLQRVPTAEGLCLRLVLPRSALAAAAQLR